MTKVINRALVIFAFLFSINGISRPDISLTIHANAPEVYINAELLVTVELRTSLPLRNGSLSRLQVKDAISELVLEGEEKDVYENGSQVKIFKRIYAVFPQVAGKMIIPAINFEGVVTRESHGFFNGFFSSGQTIQTKSNSLMITVKDVPAAYPKDQTFLPLKSLEIVDAFDEPNPRFEVNKATTRRFEIKAQGNLSSFIPALPIPKVQGVEIYAESGEKIQNVSESGVNAQISLAHVYIPYEAGDIHIPAHKIYWWDTDNDELKTTTLRPVDISVFGRSNEQINKVDTKTPDVIEKPDIKEPLISDEKSSASPSIVWQILTIIFLILWLITAIICWQMFRAKQDERIKQEQKPEPALDKLLRTAKESLEKGEGKKALNDLNSLYRYVTRSNEITNSHDISELKLCLTSLEDALYRNQNDDQVKEAMVKSKKLLSNFGEITNKDMKLKPLYPL